MLITDDESTFYSTVLGKGGGGGCLAKEYSLYALINVDNFERPLNRVQPANRGDRLIFRFKSCTLRTARATQTIAQRQITLHDTSSLHSTVLLDGFA